MQLHVIIETNLFVCGLTNIEQLALEGKDTVGIPANDTQARNCQRLGRVSLSEDESALIRVPCAGVVGIIKFGNALQLGVFGRVALLVQLGLGLKLHPAQHTLHNATLVHLPHKIITYTGVTFALELHMD